jgi:hypothetical protein
MKRCEKSRTVETCERSRTAKRCVETCERSRTAKRCENSRSEFHYVSDLAWGALAVCSLSFAVKTQ